MLIHIYVKNPNKLISEQGWHRMIFLLLSVTRSGIGRQLYTLPQCYYGLHAAMKKKHKLLYKTLILLLPTIFVISFYIFKREHTIDNILIKTLR